MSLKVLSFNIHKGIDWKFMPTSIDLIQNQIEKNDLDIIFLQEIRGNQSEQLVSKIYPYSAYGKNSNSKRGHYGNAILSKFEIISSSNIDISTHRFEKRGLLHAVIKIEKYNQQVHLLCTHLGLFKKSRANQFDMIVKYIENNIPENSPIILGGDFNDWPGHATEPLVLGLGFQEVFLSKNLSYAKTFPSWIPMLKLDRMYCRGFIVDHAQRLTDKSWKPLSDHLAIKASLRPMHDTEK